MPYGQLQVDTVKDSLNNVLAPASAVFRNRIINGAMVISQYNGTTSVTPTSGSYVIDRFFITATQASKFTTQQLSATPPMGFTNYLGITSSSAYTVLTGEIFALRHKIEGFNTADLGWGSANAKTVTLSFQVYSSLTGTFGGSLSNSAQNRSYPFSYSIPVANTWTAISVTVAGDTTGTWLTDNSTGIETAFGLGVGATYSGTAGAWAGANYKSATGATSVVGTNGATFYITGVQLEVGLNATGFEYRQYGQELALCQRYFYSLYAAQTNTVGACIGQCYSTTQVNGLQVPLPVTMRAAPTFSYSALGDWAMQTAGAGSAALSALVAASAQQGYNMVSLAATVGSGLVAGNATLLFAVNTNGRLNFGAEL